MNIVYQSKKYDPKNVTGRYVRCVGQKRKGYMFRVFETETNARTGERGCGPTLREYETAGEEIPNAVKNEAVRTKMTTKWDNPSGL